MRNKKPLVEDKSADKIPARRYQGNERAGESAGMLTSFILLPGIGGKVSYELGSLRTFFRYLSRNELHKNDFALFAPTSNKLKSREHLPSMWSVDDLQSILQCIDTGNPVGNTLASKLLKQGTRRFRSFSTLSGKVKRYYNNSAFRELYFE